MIIVSEKCASGRYLVTNSELRKAGDGRWRAVYLVRDLKTGKSRRKSATIVALTAGEARSLRERGRERLEEELNEGGTEPGRGSMTFAAWADEYLTEREGARDVTSSTLSGYRYGLRVVKDSQKSIADMKLSSITYSDVATMVAEIRGSRSNCPARKALSMTKLVLGEAMRRGYVAYNAAASVKMPKTRKRPTRILSVAEEERLLEELEQLRDESPLLSLGVRVALQAGGARRGEVCALHVESVSDDGRWLTIDHAIGMGDPERDGAHIYEKAPKSDAGIRRVPVPERLYVDLIDRKRAMRALWEREGGGDERRWRALYLLGDQHGSMPNPDVLTRQWRTFSALVGLGDVRFHDLRHTYISRLLTAGVDLKTVQYLAGHSSAAMTADVYAVMQQESVARAAETIDGVFGDKKSGSSRDL